jgi:hypothetical protein
MRFITTKAEVTDMRNKRQHKRYELIDIQGIQGKMTLANKVDIVDISAGGISVKADKKLDTGREYVIKLGDKVQCVEVRGVVVRSTLCGMEKGEDGESVLIYAAGMKFKEGQEARIKAFLDTVERQAKEDVSPAAERRLNVRFQITTPQATVLCYPANFVVKDISLNGMLIHSDQHLVRDSLVPMGLQLGENNSLGFTGKVFSCREMEEKGRTLYAIEVTFSDLAEGTRDLLKTFIGHLVKDSERDKA